jgi:hypothetical protein
MIRWKYLLTPVCDHGRTNVWQKDPLGFRLQDCGVVDIATWAIDEFFMVC